MMTSTPASTRNHIHESSKMVFEGLLGEDFHNMHATDGETREPVVSDPVLGGGLCLGPSRPVE